MIRIHMTLASDTPHLPELAPLVGRAVTITVEEVPAADPAAPLPAPAVPTWFVDPDAELREMRAWAAQFKGDAGLPTPEQLRIRREASRRLSESTYNWDTLAEQDAVDIADLLEKDRDRFS